MKKKRTMRMKKANKEAISVAIRLVFGFVLGLYIGSWCTGHLKLRDRTTCIKYPRNHDGSRMASNQLDRGIGMERNGTKRFIFIGIMTAKKYLDSRAMTVFNTWRNSINGDVVFFSSEGSIGPPGLPVINLAGTDDSYPPQKKSFSMLKYIHDHFISDYEWFMRVDDDAFIKGGKLEKLLRSINSTKLQFIGQPGMGTVNEIGKLSLSQNENFCMGGPGIVFSPSMLKAIAPYLGTCLRNMYTTHEDVEIGRCVRKFVGISCTWAFEMQYIFFQNHKEDKGSFKETLASRDTKNAVTLHPIKEPQQQYRVFTYFLSEKIMELKHKCIKLQREMNQLDGLLNIQRMEGISTSLGLTTVLTDLDPEDGDDVIPSEYIQKSLYTYKQTNPRRALEPSFQRKIDTIIDDVMDLYNTESKKKGRQLVYKKLLYAYKRVNPLSGAEYVLDMLMTYIKFRGKKMTVNVRKHVYIKQTFTDIEFTDELPYTVPYFSVASIVRPAPPQPEIINFILTLAGRFSIFRRFLLNFEAEVLNKKERAILLIIIYQNDKEPDDYKKSVSLIKEVQKRHGKTRLRYEEAPGPFIRTRALQRGAAPWSDSSLLFFIDVDILFKHDSLYRIRQNTRQGLLVYFPIVFSQFDPKTVCHRTFPCKINPYDFNSDAGYWRRSGFGMLGIYKSDFRALGGYDETIIGWGKEDVDMYQKTVNSSFTLFRSVDPHMSHIFHRINCDPNLPQDRSKMCAGAKYSTYGSAEYLTRRIYSYPNYYEMKTKAKTP